jgi:hypothetical protein
MQVPEVDHASQGRNRYTNGYGVGSLNIEFQPALLIIPEGLNQQYSHTP